MGWDDPAQGITPITKGVEAAAQVVDGLKDYGSYDLDDVALTCQDYVIEGQPKHQARARQNNAAMADCLHASISTRVSDLMLADILHWQMNLRLDGTGKKTDIAMAMFKELMRYTTLDTRSTNSIIRHQIRDLPQYSATVKGMIPLIHSRFTNLLAMLTGRHEDIDDKEDILFDTYRVSPNETFRLYMKQREEEWQEDHPNMRGADYQVIMRKALQKYNLIDALNQWDKLSPEQESIIALKAELAAVKGDALKLTKKLEDIRKNPKKHEAKANPQQGDTNLKQQQPATKVVIRKTKRVLQ
jgi:hypothetical protein